MGVLQTIEAGLQANSDSVVLSKEEAELVLKMVGALKSAKLAMDTLSKQGTDAAFVLSEMNQDWVFSEIDQTWNEGGEAYEASERINEICRVIEDRPSLKL